MGLIPILRKGEYEEYIWHKLSTEININSRVLKIWVYESGMLCIRIG